MRIKDKTAGVKPTHYATSPGKLCVMSRFDPGFSLRSKVHAAYPEIDFRGPVEKNGDQSNLRQIQVFFRGDGHANY
jgi:hypothetical protein